MLAKQVAAHELILANMQRAKDIDHKYITDHISAEEKARMEASDILRREMADADLAATKRIDKIADLLTQVVQQNTEFIAILKAQNHFIPK